jgi:hypothetical protein
MANALNHAKVAATSIVMRTPSQTSGVAASRFTIVALFIPGEPIGGSSRC